MKTKQTKKIIATCRECGTQFNYALMIVDGLCHTCRRFGGPKDRVKVEMSDEPLDLSFECDVQDEPKDSDEGLDLSEEFGL